MIPQLAPEQLRRTFDPESLGIETTENLPLLEGIIGQRRAMSALQFGLDIQEIGYNLYVAGPSGIGKMTAVQSFLEELARRKATPPDWCYVNNFEDPYQPCVLRLPTGMGRTLQQDMRRAVERFRHEIPKAFESEEYTARREEVVKGLDSERAQLMEALNERATRAGFTLQMTSFGIVMFPSSHGKPLTDEEFQALPPEARDDLQRRHAGLQEELNAAMKRIRDLGRRAQERLQEMDQQVALYIVGGLMDDMRDKYRDQPEVIEHLIAVQQDILENIENFKREVAPPQPAPQEGNPAPNPWLRELFFRKYQVNVLVDNSRTEGAPVVVELNPSYNNLFGRMEKEVQYGALATDFTQIRQGSLHKANGGFLVLPVEDVLRNLLSWDGLKRALRSGELQIEELGERLGYVATKSLRPQPIPLSVKVLLVGRPLLYYLLHAHDEDFSELFKVKADFDTRMDNNPENLRDFLSFLSTFCTKEKLKHLDKSAVARLLEHSARLAEDQNKLTTHFGALADLIREASFWAQQEGTTHVRGPHVRQALEERIYRANLISEHYQEMIARGTVLISTTGEAVGQVNGLSVISLGDYLFGKPSRITASAVPGREGVIDIEREVELGGPIHSKGVLILSGYLAQQFAQQQPLTLAARLVFEQSYEGVEGDSASSTELYALLSALSGLPLKQGIAVTGSVNQHGEVQAIGGVNQKIEGFFEVCRTRGLTGEQGVMIPFSNIGNLMLREEVVEAVIAGKFSIWAVKSIAEGIEILTGVPAGSRDARGNFPEGTVYHRVQQTLEQFAAHLKTLTAGQAPQRPRGRRGTASRAR